MAPKTLTVVEAQNINSDSRNTNTCCDTNPILKYQMYSLDLLVYRSEFVYFLNFSYTYVQLYYKKETVYFLRTLYPNGPLATNYG